MATEITVKLWTAANVDRSASHAIAVEAARQLALANGVDAAVAEHDAVNVEPHDIIVAAHEFAVEAALSASDDEAVGESGYPAADEPIHDDDVEAPLPRRFLRR